MKSSKSYENKKKYVVAYAKEHYKRVPLDLTTEFYNEVKAAAERNGESVNGFIKKALKIRLSDVY